MSSSLPRMTVYSYSIGNSRLSCPGEQTDRSLEMILCPGEVCARAHGDRSEVHVKCLPLSSLLYLPRQGPLKNVELAYLANLATHCILNVAVTDRPPYLFSF